jgi:hypothetical protein
VRGEFNGGFSEMATVSKERVTLSLSPGAVSFLDRFKRVKRVSRSRAMELLIEERRRQDRRKLFAAEARACFVQENPAHRKEADAMEVATLEDWRRRET